VPVDTSSFDTSSFDTSSLFAPAPLVDESPGDKADARFMERRSGPRNERRRAYNMRRQLDVLVPLSIVWLGGIGILGAVAARGNVEELFLDPAYYNGGSWWTGIVSQLGLVGWTVACASASWAAWIAQQHVRKRAVAFLRAAALVSVWLLLDDAIGIHSMLANLFHSRLSLPIALAKVLGLVLTLGPVGRWATTYRSDIARTRWQVLVAAVLANGLSLFVDVAVAHNASQTRALFEDGAKFLGVLAWTTYIVTTTYDIARSAIVPNGERTN
jgi:hypothetical protein